MQRERERERERERKGKGEQLHYHTCMNNSGGISILLFRLPSGETSSVFLQTISTCLPHHGLHTLMQTLRRATEITSAVASPPCRATEDATALSHTHTHTYTHTLCSLSQFILHPMHIHVCCSHMPTHMKVTDFHIKSVVSV